MKGKNLIILVAAAVLLGGIAYLTNRKQDADMSVSEDIGKFVLPVLQDNDTIGAIKKIRFTSADSRIVFTDSEQGWIAETKYGYPVDFDNVRNFVRDMSKMIISDTLPSDPAMIEQLALIEPGKAGEKKDAAGVLVELTDAQDKVLASVLVGKEHRRATGTASQGIFGNYPDGRFILADGKVCLVSQTFDGIPAKEKEWLNDNLSSVFSGDITAVSVKDNTGKTIELKTGGEDKKLLLPDLAKDEEMDSSAVSTLSSVLNYLSFNDIADPKLGPADTGLDKPTLYRVALKNGQTYTLKIGKQDKDSGDRFVQLAVEFTPPPVKEPGEKAEADKKDEEAEKKAKEVAEKQKAENEKTGAETEKINNRLGGWTYFVSGDRLECVNTDRNSLVKKIEKEEDKKEPADKKPE